MNNRGFLTIAQNNNDTNFIKLAYALALSLKSSQSKYNKLSIAVTNKTEVPENYKWAFDNIIEIPWGDAAINSKWKLENEWKLYHITPYDETIKLDTDMIFTNDISNWWDIFSQREVCIPTKVYNLQNEIVENNYYRPGYCENNLPKLHTAFMYFKKSDTAHELFSMAEIITQNWERFYWSYMPINSPKVFSTDTTFSLASKISELNEKVINPWDNYLTFTHAKTRLHHWGDLYQDEDWSNFLPFNITPNLECFIGCYRINKPLHYHLKHLITDEIISFYENKVK